MNISEVKQIRITDFLQSLGHRPVKIRCGQYWYLSPLRTENTPSFKVNDPTNEWYDFGIAEGGGIIELAMLLYQTSNINEVLRHISAHADGVPCIRSRPFCPLPGRIEDTMKNITVSPLNHYALLSYLHSRSIDTGIAQRYCKEIHYDLYRRHYFAIAFENVSGGYEMRNPYYKGCIRKKDISIIEYAAGGKQEHVCIFEGFTDFLSYQTLLKQNNAIVCVQGMCDHIIMNSVSNLKKTLEVLGEYKYIHCYLDNDLAGEKTTETIAGLYGIRVVNEAIRYIDYKDLNDCLRGKRR